MKIENSENASPLSFMPASFWVQGPWAFFNMGLQFFQTWQNECFTRLRLVPSATKPVAKTARQVPVLGCMQNVEVVGGSVSAAPEAVKVAEPTAQKAAPVTAPVAKAAVVAVKTSAPAKAKAAVAPAAKPVLQSPPLAEPVAKPVLAEPTPATVAEVPTADAAPMSVTSMLAMQAKSLAKAVTTAPRQPAVAAKTAKSTGKPAAVKKAAPAAKAKAPATVKTEASKKA